MDAFNQRNPDTQVSLVAQPEGTYQQLLERAAAQKQLPCLLDLDGPNIPYWAARGHLLALDPLVDREGFQRRMLRTIYAQGLYGGRLYSLGQYDSGLALWGNRRWLAKAGVRIPFTDLKPWTLEEFETALAALKKAGARQAMDMKFEYGVGEWLTYAVLPVIQGHGGEWVTEQQGHLRAQGALDSPATVQAMRSLQQWIKQGWIDPTGKGANDFPEGRAGLSYAGHWVYRDYRKALGEDLVLLPMPHFGAKTVTGAGAWGWAIAASCAHPKEAARVLEHFMTKEEVRRVTQANGAIPAVLDAILSSHEYGMQGPLRIYVDQIMGRKARLRPVTPAYPQISAVFSSAVQAVAEGADVQDVLQKAAARTDQILKEAQR